MAPRKYKVHSTIFLPCLCFNTENGKFLQLYELQNLAEIKSLISFHQQRKWCSIFNEVKFKELLVVHITFHGICKITSAGKKENRQVLVKFLTNTWNFPQGTFNFSAGLSLQRERSSSKKTKLFCHRTLHHSSPEKQSALDLSPGLKLHHLHTNRFDAKRLILHILSL